MSDGYRRVVRALRLQHEARQAMKDFNAFKVPDQLVRYMQTIPETERDRVAGEFARRAVAANFLLKAVVELRLALNKLGDDGYACQVEQKIEEVWEIARGVHDYDPTSD